MNQTKLRTKKYRRRYLRRLPKILLEIRRFAETHPGVPAMPPDVTAAPPRADFLPLAPPPSWSPDDGILPLLSGVWLEELAELPARSPTIWDFVRSFYLKLAHVDAGNAWGAVRSLVRVVQDGLCGRLGQPLAVSPGRADWRNICGVLALPAAILDWPLVHSFLLVRYHAAMAIPDRELGYSAMRSANSILNSARSIFSRARLPQYKEAGLTEHEGLDYFLHAKLIDVPKKVHYAITVEHFEQLLAATARLQQDDPPVFIILTLALYGSTRAGEGLNALTRGLVSSLEETCLQLGNQEGFRTKSRRARRSRLIQRAYGTLQRLAEGRTYLVHDDKAERTAAYQRAIQFLKKHGITDDKPEHYLRRLYASAIALRDGLEAARLALGHASKDTTYHHYVLVGYTEQHLKIWERGPFGPRR